MFELRQFHRLGLVLLCLVGGCGGSVKSLPPDGGMPDAGPDMAPTAAGEAVGLMGVTDDGDAVALLHPTGVGESDVYAGLDIFSRKVEFDVPNGTASPADLSVVGNVVFHTLYDSEHMDQVLKRTASTRQYGDLDLDILSANIATDGKRWIAQTRDDGLHVHDLAAGTDQLLLDASSTPTLSNANGYLVIERASGGGDATRPQQIEAWSPTRPLTTLVAAEASIAATKGSVILFHATPQSLATYDLASGTRYDDPDVVQSTMLSADGKTVIAFAADGTIRKSDFTFTNNGNGGTVLAGDSLIGGTRDLSHLILTHQGQPVTIDTATGARATFDGTGVLFGSPPGNSFHGGDGSTEDGHFLLYFTDVNDDPYNWSATLKAAPIGGGPSQTVMTKATFVRAIGGSRILYGDDKTFWVLDLASGAPAMQPVAGKAQEPVVYQDKYVVFIGDSGLEVLPL